MVTRQSGTVRAWILRLLACVFGAFIWVAPASASVGTCTGAAPCAHHAMPSCLHGVDHHDACSAEVCASVVLPTDPSPAVDAPVQSPQPGPALADLVAWPPAAPALPQARPDAAAFTRAPRFLVLGRILR